MTTIIIGQSMEPDMRSITGNLHKPKKETIIFIEEPSSWRCYVSYLTSDCKSEGRTEIPPQGLLNQAGAHYSSQKPGATCLYVLLTKVVKSVYRFINEVYACTHSVKQNNHSFQVFHNTHWVYDDSWLTGNWNHQAGVCAQALKNPG